MTPDPIYTRLFQVHDRFGVSQDTVRRLAKAGKVTIYRIGRCSVVRNDEMRAAFEVKQ